MGMNYLDCPYCDSANVLFVELERKPTYYVKKYVCKECNREYKIRMVYNKHLGTTMMEYWHE